MKRKLFKNLIFIPFFCGCSSYLDLSPEIETPGWRNLRQNIEVINKYDLSTIVNITYNKWHENFNFKSKNDEDNLFENISNLEIVWVDEIPVDIRYFPKDIKIFALTKSSRNINIDLEFQDKFIPLFTHEFVHIVLWAINKEPDPDHEEGIYKGWNNKHTEWIKKTEFFIKEYFEFKENLLDN